METKEDNFSKVNSAKLDISFNSIIFLSRALQTMQKGIDPVVINGVFLCKNSLSSLVDLVQKRLFYVQWCQDETGQELFNNAIAVYFYPTEKLKVAIPEFKALQSIEISTPLRLHQKIIRASEKPSFWLKRHSAADNLDLGGVDEAAGGEFESFLLKPAPFFSQV